MKLLKMDDGGLAEVEVLREGHGIMGGVPHTITQARLDKVLAKSESFSKEDEGHVISLGRPDDPAEDALQMWTLEDVEVDDEVC